MRMQIWQQVTLCSSASSQKVKGTEIEPKNICYTSYNHKEMKLCDLQKQICAPPVQVQCTF